MVKESREFQGFFLELFVIDNSKKFESPTQNKRQKEERKVRFFGGKKLRYSRRNQGLSKNKQIKTNKKMLIRSLDLLEIVSFFFKGRKNRRKSST